MKTSMLLIAVVCLTCSLSGGADVITLDQTVAGAIGADTTSADAVLGSGAWQANGTSKSSLYMDMVTLFGRSVQVQEVARISWYTKKGEASNFDWYLSVYTEGSRNGWYDDRFTMEGLYANSYSNPVNEWVQWNTDAGTNQLTIYDGTNGTNYGFYNGPTLADITAGAINWGDYATSGSSAVVNYTQKNIKYMVWETGSGWAGQYTGLLDAIEVELTDGSVATLDLEVVPEPATLALLGLGGLLVRRKRA